MRLLKYLCLFALVAAAWWSCNMWLPRVLNALYPATPLAKFGSVGDSFAALNTLFSGLAFAAIVLSIHFQWKALQATHEEVQAQGSQQAKLSFESSFFQLLNFSNQIVANFKYESPFSNAPKPSTGVGKECFEQIRGDFASVCLHGIHWGETSEQRYEKFYLLYAHDQLGHYFRNLYQIVKLVDSSQLEDKKFYTNIIRAQLSTHELYVLFYNGLSSFGREKFFPLLIKYAFFEHLPVSTDILQADAKKYGLGAFGTSPEWKTRFEAHKA